MFDQDIRSRTVIAWFTVAVCLIGCVYYYLFFFNRAFVEVDIEVEHKSDFKIYWTSGDRPFSEKRRATVRLHPGKNVHSFFLTNIGKFEKLRIDPFQFEGDGTLRKLTISQLGYEPIEVDLSNLISLHDIASTTLSPDGLLISSTGIDPYLLLEPEVTRKPINLLVEMARYGLIIGLILAVMVGCAPLAKNFTYVPVLLAVVLTLILVMAAVSKRNAHPDEYVHLRATEYYQQRWLPPEADDESVANTYSVYGVSRLNNGEIYYLLAGKLSKVLEVLRVNQLFAMRAFNVLLFGLIFLYATKSVPARLVALPFLLSPQVWYIFSYCVSDAFGLFLCFLAACEVVREESYLNRILDGNRSFSITGTALVAILLGSIFLLKINYYPFIILIYGVIFWRWLQSPDNRSTVLLRVLAVSMIALVLAGGRIGADYYVNGLDRDDKLSEMQEKTAHHWYKPSTELHKKHVSMYMKQRGTTLKELIYQRKWFAHTFETGVGKYGYFTIGAPEIYYWLMKWCLIAFFVYVCGAIALKGNTEGRLMALLAVGLTLALIGASVHRSWTIDFQAQGRYLFPVLPMIGMVLATNRPLMDTKVFILIIVHLFLLSLYSFIFIALPVIPRI